MAETFSAVVDNAALDNKETTIGASPIIRAYSGTMPANVDTALGANVVLAQGTLPADWLGAATARVKSKAGTWTLTGQVAAGAGTAMICYRIFESTGTTAHLQGNIGVASIIATNALTAANGNVLNFASTTGVAVGQKISGTGIATGARVIALTGTTVTMSQSSTAGVASAASITFGHDLNVDNTSIANAQVMTVNSFTLTAPAST